MLLKRYYTCTRKVFLIPVLVFLSWAGIAQDKKNGPPPLAVINGRLVYTPDSLGNRIPDFSYSGYTAGINVIPNAPIKIIVPARNGDMTAEIQQALDYVGSLPVDKDGLRGVVLLQKGTYEVQGSLLIRASGVVLRGSGFDEKGTILLGAGTDRATLIRIAGGTDKSVQKPVIITDEYVPVNAQKLKVADRNFKAGDKVIIHRPSTIEWIKELRTDHFGGGITATGWKPGQRDLYWDRTITAVNNNEIELDAPITTAIDHQYGGGTVSKYDWPGRIAHAGVENIYLQSAYDKSNPKDEDHRWMAITIENAEDVWVRRARFEHFAGSAVYVLETAKRITVEDCKSLAPVSEIGGERRNSFFTAGQQTLFQRCYAEYGIHDFATGFCAAGPNAFVQCESVQPFGFSGAIDSWSSGTLFDDVRIDGRGILLSNRGQDGNGAGWCAANSVLWNCTASRIECYKPPTAQNWSFGSWAQFQGDGYWAESNNHIEPRSLHNRQLAARLGEAWVNQTAKQFIIETDATSSPTVEQAAALTAEAKKPVATLSQFIDLAILRGPLEIGSKDAKISEQPKPVQNAYTTSVLKNNGWLVYNDHVLTGGRASVPWWSGSARPYALKNARPAITRFVPGRIGHGLTDDLHALVDTLKAQNVSMIEQNYGLWYDRRRDDHERVRREDGDVWAPFYELPFARSGQGTAYDGLSKYDLTKYNEWYWKRLFDFSNISNRQGVVLLYQHYFQHNIIEAGAHYTDFPWRSANNINNTGMPEPPPYAGDKRIFLAEQFYDTTNAVRRQLHKKYIRHSLDYLGGLGVIHTISEEYTGPLHFVQFWLNTVEEWRREKNQKAIIGLSTTKDVQDAILSNSRYAKQIDVIDIRYWHYQADGSLYAPQGGQNLAPRQHARLLKPKSSSFEQVYRAVSEYRKKYPNKAVIYSADGYDKHGWAVFMAGGSLASIPQMPEGFLKHAAKMNTWQHLKGSSIMGNQDGYIIYLSKNESFALGSFNIPDSVVITWFDPATGLQTAFTGKHKGDKEDWFYGSEHKPVVAWVRRAPSNAMKLSVSPNGRYFMTADGKPFFWLGDTGWLLFSKLKRSEAIRYLDDRKEKGYNVVQAMILHTLQVVNAYGDSALQNKNVATPRITEDSDYWDHMDYIIDAAAERGIYIAMVPIWGGNVKAGHVSVEQAKQYAAFLAKRYKDKPNIIWLNGGDIKGSDSINVWKAIGETLHNLDRNHLQTFHPRGRATSSIWFHNEPWLQFNMFQSGHRTYAQDTSAADLRFGEDNWRYVEKDFALSPKKPTLDGEPSYEKIPYGLHDTTLPVWNGADLRRYAYWSVFAGACGFTYGHNAVMQMHRPGDADANFGVKDAWYNSLNDEGAQHMKYLKDLMLSRSYFDRVPDQSLIAGNAGERYERLLATRGEKYALIYTYTGRNIPVKMGKIAGQKVNAYWFDPRTGTKTGQKTYDNKGVVTFDPPGTEKEGNDWVLVLESVTK